MNKLTVLKILVVTFVSLLIFKNASFGEDFFTTVESGSVDAVKQALKEGAGVNSKNELGKTPLMIALEANNTELAAFLISKGAEVNASTPTKKIVQMKKLRKLKKHCKTMSF
jgi:ankyrin repeat protein